MAKIGQRIYYAKELCCAVGRIQSKKIDLVETSTGKPKRKTVYHVYDPEYGEDDVIKLDKYEAELTGFLYKSLSDW